MTTLMLMLSPGLAYAYLDPGTGSLLLQSLVGAIAMGFGAISFYWARIKTWLRGPKKEAPKDDEQNAEPR